MRFAVALVTAAALGVATQALGQTGRSVVLGDRKPVTITGRITGQESSDFRVRLAAGQSLTVSLKSDTRTARFNVLAPKSGAVMHNGGSAGSVMSSRRIPIGGEYTVRVYQLGGAASARRMTGFTLALAARGKSLRALPSSRDAKLTGTPFHARGIVHCALARQPNRYTCDAYVIRYGGGSATVEFRSGRLVRRVLFVGGKPVASDSSEAFTYARSGDDTVVRFGDDPSEEFTVVDALVYGG